MKKHRPPAAGHTRRSFLRIGAATAATAAGALLTAGKAHAGADDVVARDVRPDAVPEDPHAFFLGVAAGEPTPTTALLWTRYDGDRPLRLVVWDDAGQQVVHHDAPRTARGPLEIPVDALKPHTEYRYVFYTLENDQPVTRSRVGRFKTTPPDDALVPITLGATCCIMNGMDQSVLAAAGKRTDLDALIQLGDAVYADGSESLADYRMRWWDNLSKPGYQAMRASTGMIVTWDDHEVDNDWDPECVTPHKLDAARTAFFEHMPVCREETCPNRLWRRRRFGKTVEVFVLDCRGERKRSCSPKQYIGDEQMAWLKAGLKDSEAMFKVIVNSVPITRFPPIFSSSRQDRWETFPEQRLELLTFIEEEQLPGVMFLAGDFHLATIARASPYGIGSKTMEVLAGPGAQVGHALTPWLFGKQFDWASPRNNVTSLEFDPLRARVDIKYQGHDGSIFHHAAYRRRHTRGFDKIEDWLT